ncbi:MAG TPA: hypothetical protein DCE42_16965 [Myxococcales bacterium]|nr:hypothetical protein [Myxococcales bacterium]
MTNFFEKNTNIFDVIVFYRKKDFPNTPKASTGGGGKRSAPGDAHASPVAARGKRSAAVSKGKWQLARQRAPVRASGNLPDKARQPVSKGKWKLAPKERQ